MFYDLLDRNLKMLKEINEYEDDEISSRRGGNDNSIRLSKILNAREIKKYKGFTEDDEEYIKKVIQELDSGAIPKKISQKIYLKIKESPEILVNPIKLLGILKINLPNEFLQPTQNDKKFDFSRKREIILSEYFTWRPYVF